jgi:hypothetical protein
MHERDMEIRVRIDWPAMGLTREPYVRAYRIPDHEYDAIRPIPKPLDPRDYFEHQERQKRRRAQIDRIAQNIANSLAAALEKGDER